MSVWLEDLTIISVYALNNSKYMKQHQTELRGELTDSELYLVCHKIISVIGKTTT